MSVTITVTGANLQDAIEKMALGAQQVTSPPLAPMEPKPAPGRSRKKDKPEPETIEGTATEVTEGKTAPTSADLKAKLIELSAATDDASAPVSLLAEFGAKKVSEVPVDKIQAAIDAAQAKIDVAGKK
jgi:hypothetical protein